MERGNWKWLRTLLTVTALVVILTVAAFAADIAIGIGIVDTDGGLWLRAGPGYEYELIDAASEGDDVVVYSQEGDWYLVNYNLKTGYMSSEYITFLDKENVELGDGMVTDALVNLRGTPETGGTLLDQIEEGETAYIIGLNNGWYKVEYENYTGYIRSDLLELTDLPLENSLGYYYGSYTATTVGETIVAYAESLLGTPYVWGGTSTSGFDCSGFCQYVYEQMGYSINRTADAQMDNGTSVSMSDLQPGDLVFFVGTYSCSGASHVGIYIGNGNFIHASSSSGCVKISSLSSTYYTNHFYGARRIV